MLHFPALLLCLAAPTAVTGEAPRHLAPQWGLEEESQECHACAFEYEEEERLLETSLLQTGLMQWSDAFDDRFLSNRSSRPIDVSGRLLSMPLRLANFFQSGVVVHTEKQKAGSGLRVVWVVVAVVVIVLAVLLTLLLQSHEPSTGGTQGHLEKMRSTQVSLHAPSFRAPSLRAPPSLIKQEEPGPVPASAASVVLPPTAAMPPTSAPGPAMMVDTSGGPPPICASLILPNTEARFMISMESLLSITTGALDVLGTSGRKLLHASIEDLPGGSRSLALASDGCESDPRAVIHTINTDQDANRSLAVFGRGGRAYGTLETSGNGGAVLRYQGMPVMRIEPGNAPDLGMTAFAQDGRVLATAGRGIAGRRNPDGVSFWRLHVRPGVDAVLITSSMLAVLLLLPSPARMSLQPSLAPRASYRSPAQSMLPSFPRMSSSISGLGRP